MNVTLDIQNDIALITIDDGNKNVINHEVLTELESAWEKAEADASAVILAGREGSFCAGFDLNVMTGSDRDAGLKLGQRGGRFAHTLFGSAIPTVGLAAGHALTIGAVWMACCDIRIGESGAFKYGLREVALNVPFSAWPLQPLKERLARQHLVPAILHSRMYDPEGALEAGFIDQLVPAGAGMDAAMAAAAGLAELPRKAYSVSKRVLRAEPLAIMAAELHSSASA